MEASIVIPKNYKYSYLPQTPPSIYMPKRRRGSAGNPRKRRKLSRKPVRRTRRNSRARNRSKIGINSAKTKSVTSRGVLKGKKFKRTAHCIEPDMAKGERIKTVAQLNKFLSRATGNRNMIKQPYDLPLVSMRHYYHTDEHHSITPTLGAEVQELQQFSMTSTFAPEISGGHQPTGRDTLAARYNHYIVTAVDWKLKIKNFYVDVDSETSDADEVYVVIWFSSSTSTTTPTTIDTMEEVKESIAIGGGHTELDFVQLRAVKIPMPKLMAIGNAAGPNKDDEGSMIPGRKQISGTFRISKWPTQDLGSGLSTISRLKNFTSQSGGNSSPAAIMHIAVGNKNNWHTSNDNPIVCEAELVYHTTWFEPNATLATYTDN